MKNNFKIIVTIGLSIILQIDCICQQKKTFPTKKPQAKTNKSTAATNKPKTSTFTNTSTSSAPKVEQLEKVYIPQKTTSDIEDYKYTKEQAPILGKVVKLNFANLIVGGLSMDLENSLSSKQSIILSGGYYIRGVLKGNYRLGADFRQYLGESKAPKGIFVSIGAMGNYFKYTNEDNGEKINLTFLNIRALFGYQALSGHFTFEGAIGPGYGILLSKSIGAEDAKIPIGILPAAKLSIGYTF
jgi:hypothetical protein